MYHGSNLSLLFWLQILWSPGHAQTPHHIFRCFGPWPLPRGDLVSVQICPFWPPPPCLSCCCPEALGDDRSHPFSTGVSTLQTQFLQREICEGDSPKSGAELEINHEILSFGCTWGDAGNCSLKCSPAIHGTDAWHKVFSTFELWLCFITGFGERGDVWCLWEDINHKSGCPGRHVDSFLVNLMKTKGKTESVLVFLWGVNRLSVRSSVQLAAGQEACL